MANPASIRLGTTGKAQVKADFADIGSTGAASFKAIGDAGDVQAKRWSKSYENAGRDVEAALERQRLAAAKISAIIPQTAVQMQVNAAAGSNTRFGGGYAASANDRQTSSEGTARQSAMFFAELAAEEERVTARTRALVSAIDPAFAAQDRFNREIGEARTLVSAGTLSLDQYVVNAIAQLAAKWTLSQIGKLSGSGGFIGSLASLISGKPKVGTNASGTEYWSGGMSLVGENGPEIVSMARGSRVTPAAETRRMLSANDNRSGPSNHFHLEGAVVTQDLLDQMVAIGNGAAVRGATGGSEMAGRNLSLSRKAGRLPDGYSASYSAPSEDGEHAPARLRGMADTDRARRSTKARAARQPVRAGHRYRATPLGRRSPRMDRSATAWCEQHRSVPCPAAWLGYR